MLKKKKTIKTIAIITFGVIFIVFLIIGIIQCHKINKKYPSPEIIAGDMSKAIFTNHNNLRVVATEFELRKIDELVDDHSLLFDYDTDSRIALVKLNVTNISNEHEAFDLTSPVLTTNGWKNGLFLELFMELNPNYDLDLDPNESVDIVAPYVMFDYQFQKNIWKKISNQHFRIFFQVYPEKKYIDLNSSNL